MGLPVTGIPAALGLVSDCQVRLLASPWCMLYMVDKKIMRVYTKYAQLFVQINLTLHLKIE